VTFNNAAGSTKAYDYIRQHMASTNAVDFVPPAEEITTDYAPGTDQTITMHDGSQILLQKIDDKLDIHSRRSALTLMKDYKAEGKVLTGLLYIDPESQEIHETMNTTKTPLRNLTEKELCPGPAKLEEINAILR
jgi:2-oxoglutarate ferredoxin oxidoreductase subunit beta